MDKVKIKFPTHQYYNDLDTPLFEGGKVYEIDNEPAMVERWQKRGGEIGDFEGEEVCEAPEQKSKSTVQVQAAEPVDPATLPKSTVPPSETAADIDQSIVDAGDEAKVPAVKSTVPPSETVADLNDDEEGEEEHDEHEEGEEEEHDGVEDSEESVDESGEKKPKSRKKSKGKKSKKELL